MTKPIAGQTKSKDTPKGTPFDRAVGDVAKESGVSRVLLYKEATHRKISQAAARVLAAETYVPTPVLRLSDLLSINHVDIVEGFLAQGTMNMILGPSNVGKTFVSVDLAGSLIYGLPWFGRTVQPTPVVYIQAEGSSRKFGERLLAWLEANKPEDDDGEDQTLMEFCLRILQSANLQSDVSLEEIGSAIAEVKASTGNDHCVVIVDTYAATAGIEDENDAASVANTLRRLRDAVDGATIILLHHPNKASERSGGRLDSRGSGALRGALDTTLVVIDDGEMTEAKANGTRYLRLTTDPAMGGKVREGKPVDIRAVHLEDVGTSAVLVQDGGPVYAAGTNKLLALLNSTDIDPDGFTKADINEAVGKDAKENSAEAKWLKIAEADGAIRKTHKDGARQVYALN